MRVLFLDRDGIINKDFGHVGQLNRFTYTDDFFQNMKFSLGADVSIIIVTNQAGIAKDLYTWDQHRQIEKKIRNDFAKHDLKLLDYLFCPHHPEGVISIYRKTCSCRKPEPGMLNLARLKFNIDMSASVLIGDKSTDITAGIRAGVGANLLVEKDNSIAINKAFMDAANHLKI